MTELKEKQDVLLLTSNDVVHHAIQYGQQLLTDEGCNIDQTDSKRITEGELIGPHHMCERCFP